jgi:fructose-bisphosphate aldolase class II
MRKKRLSLPAVNVTGSSTINGVLETAAKLNAPVIIQFSNGGAQFNAEKDSNANESAMLEVLLVQNTYMH